MPDPWTTPAEPGMRDRRFCPLCSWFLDSSEPEPFPRLDEEWVQAAIAKHGKLAYDPVFLALLRHIEPIEAALREHLETHALEEWVVAAVKLFTLQRTVDVLADVPSPDPDRVYGLVCAGALTVNDGLWIQHARVAVEELAAKLGPATEPADA